MSVTPPYTVDVRRLEEFAAADLYRMLKLRVDVFVVEQECAYAELDGHDFDAMHLRLMSDDELIACARFWQPAGEPPRIGRVAVSESRRGLRLGEALMREAILQCEKQFPQSPIALSAQSHLQRFYESFGFQPVSEEYLEDGIPHIDMLRPSPGQ